MKTTILLGLLVLAGCVKDSPDQKPGQLIRRLEPISMTAELSRIEAICNALISKTERLPDMIGSKYTFAYSEKNCSDSERGAENEVGVSLQSPDGKYVFRKTNGESFPFNVETSDYGTVAIICKNLADLKSPIVTSTKGAVWFTTITRARDCASDYDSMCLHLQKGEDIGNLNYSIHTDEWIRFKIRDARRGFFVERKLISSADCAKGNKIERRAALK